MTPYDQGYTDGKEGRTANSPDDTYGRSQYLQGYNAGCMEKEGISPKTFAPGSGRSYTSGHSLSHSNDLGRRSTID